MSYDILQVKRATIANPELFINEYYPNAKRKGHNYFIGDVQGSEGNSTVISINGNHAGHYYDFADSDKRSDFIDMLQKKEGISKHDAINKIAELYRIEKQVSFNQNKVEIKPIKPKKDASPIQGDVSRYLSAERGINDEIQKLYRLESYGDQWLIFPSIDKEGQVIQRAYCSIHRDEKGKKIFRQDNGAQHFFFGLHLVDESLKHLIITEGQIDCMTLTAVGLKNVVSLPMGVGKSEFINIHWDLLMSFEEIILCFDQDDPGKSFASEVAKRIGIERCRIVKMPMKDPNELWNNGYDENDIEKFVMIDSEYLPNENVESIGSDILATQRYLEQLDNNDGIPFFLSGVEFNQRLGELTIWSGYSGSGKTTILNQSILTCIINGNAKVCYASFEQNKHDLALLCCRQLYGKVNSTFIEKSLRFLDDKIYWYNHNNKGNPTHMLESFEYAQRRYGCDFFVVDNLVTCGIPEGENEDQRKFVDTLKNFAVTNHVNVSLVAHSRKSDKDDNETKIPSKHSVRGSASITDICMNGITVWRNPLLEEEKDIDMPFDGILKIWKQRATGETPKMGYYFNKALKLATRNIDSSAQPILGYEKENTNGNRENFKSSLF